MYLFRSNYSDAKLITHINSLRKENLNNINLVLNAVGNSAAYDINMVINMVTNILITMVMAMVTIVQIDKIRLQLNITFLIN